MKTIITLLHEQSELRKKSERRLRRQRLIAKAVIAGVLLAGYALSCYLDYLDYVQAGIRF